MQRARPGVTRAAVLRDANISCDGRTMPDSLIPTVPAVAKVHPARLSLFPALESGQCPQPAEADITAQTLTSGVDPKPT